MNEEKKTAGYFLGLIAKILLAVAMLLYLGLHSFNFFMFTFKGEQWIFAMLGLFTTSIGFLLWLAIYLYAAEDGLEKAVSIIMMFVALFGEFATAGFDMYMNISDSMNMAQFTASDVRNMSYIIAGLALLNGLALVAGVAGQQIMNDLRSVKSPKKSPKQNNQPAPVMVANASETENVGQLEKKSGDDEIYGYLRGEPVTVREAREMIADGFEDGTGKGLAVNPTSAARQNGKSR